LIFYNYHFGYIRIMEDIPLEILLNIIKNGDIKTSLNIRSLCKDYFYSNIINEEINIILQKNFNTIIGNRLSQYGVDKNDFDNILIKNNACISGSYPLSCITNNMKNSSDIDIYYKMTKPTKSWEYSDLETDICNLFNIYIGDIMHTPHMFLHKNKPENYNNTYDTVNSIYNEEIVFVRNIVIKNGDNNIKLDLIMLNVKPEEFIESNFDIDGCQIIYNGKNLYHPTKELYNFIDRNVEIVRLSKVFPQYDVMNSLSDLILSMKSNINNNNLSNKYLPYIHYLDIELDKLLNKDININLFLKIKNLLLLYKNIIPENLDIVYNNSLMIEGDKIKCRNSWLRIYRLLLRCLKYAHKGYTIKNFNDYFL
ncbi:Hypothetical protein ORPV_295, partial [Orpheovirus IHUMI-LCC2]